jgi:hypothetical protein
MSFRVKRAKQLFRIVVNNERQRLGMSTDVNVERERAKFVADICEADRAAIALLAANLETDRILRDTAAAGVAMSQDEKATFREIMQTSIQHGAASIGLSSAPSQERQERLDAFLIARELAKANPFFVPRSMHGVSIPSSAAY